MFLSPAITTVCDLARSSKAAIGAAAAKVWKVRIADIERAKMLHN
ncbi:hypothetical protein NAS141_06343 [Sulfitobacter sp. NAS-14.1]|nr:hypothetical protein NAS141_06343 [Sulfitobacter sp. NAS-14.1]